MSREQKLVAALREAQQCLYRDGANAAGEVKALIDAVLGDEEAPTEQAERGDVERWPGTTERPWFVEGLTAMDRFRSRVILYVGDSDQDRADLAMIVDAVNAYAASAPQGEPEPREPCAKCGYAGGCMEPWAAVSLDDPSDKVLIPCGTCPPCRASTPQGEAEPDVA